MARFVQGLGKPDYEPHLRSPEKGRRAKRGIRGTGKVAAY